jgi:prolipoprotein diacylglyceryl transferase
MDISAITAGRVLAYIPSPTISFIRIGSVTIHFYALTMLAGMIVAIWILTHRWKKYGGTFDQVLDVSLITIICGLIGARLFHVVTVPYAYFPPTGNPANILKVWEGGMAIFGGLIGGFLAAWAWAHHKGYSVLLLADALAPGLLVAQAIGRLGNWFNQELYGAPTTLPWGLKLNSAPAIGKSEQCYTGSACPLGQNTLFHPTFLYEMIWNLIGAALIVWVVGRFARKLKGGQIFAIYLMWYGLGRTWIETLRINLSSEFLGVRINVWAALVTVFIGILLFTILLRYGHSRDVLVEQLEAVTREDLKREQAEEQKAEDKRRARKHRSHHDEGQKKVEQTVKQTVSSESDQSSHSSQLHS